MSATAKDIARLLGVSPATVSLVFRNKPGVSDAVREKVIATAQEVGFEYSAIPGQRHSNTIQFIIYKRHGKVVSSTSFFDRLTQGVSDKVHQLGYQLSIAYFYGTENSSEQLRTIASSKCAGIILLATEMKSSDMEPFQNLHVPVVLLDNWFPNKRYDAVVIDNTYAAWRAVHHLIRSGHTRIGYLHSKVEIRNFRERRDGYLNAVNALKDADNDSSKRIISLGTTTESAFEDMMAYLATNPVLPTAFFADNDIIALGCMRALLKSGYCVPEEVSMIGFDDMPICQMIDPQLTTMAVPNDRMGALAVERLDKRIRGKTAEIVRIAVFPEIVKRASVYNRAANAAEPNAQPPKED
ncbi:MAG: LacI family DNA-binding transcriptional regulator [Gemmiger sp.]|nr:LacI family DNA-binding transcriptional regulator [Gemmiger sp.]